MTSRATTAANATPALISSMPRSAAAPRAIGTTRRVAGSGTNPREDHADEPQRQQLWDFEVDPWEAATRVSLGGCGQPTGSRCRRRPVSGNRHYDNLRPGRVPR